MFSDSGFDLDSQNIPKVGKFSTPPHTGIPPSGLNPRGVGLWCIDLQTQKCWFPKGPFFADQIKAIAITFDNKFLFSSYGVILRQFSVQNHSLVKAYILRGYISSIAITPDNKHVFIGSHKGTLVQMCIETQEVIKDYGRLHCAPICSMVVTGGSEFLVTTDDHGRTNKICVESGGIVV